MLALSASLGASKLARCPHLIIFTWERLWIGEILKQFINKLQKLMKNLKARKRKLSSWIDSLRINFWTMREVRKTISIWATPSRTLSKSLLILNRSGFRNKNKRLASATRGFRMNNSSTSRGGVQKPCWSSQGSFTSSIKTSNFLLPKLATWLSGWSVLSR